MADALFLIVLIPVLTAALVALLPQAQARIARGVAVVGTLIPAVFALMLYVSYHPTSSTALQDRFAVTWMSVANAFGGSSLRIELGFGVDGISLPLLMLVGVVSVLAVLRSFKVSERVRAYYFWTLLLVSGLYGVFGAADLFTLFFFLELTLVATYFLIGAWGGDKRQYAAMKFLVYRGLASAVLLAGLVGLAYAYAAQAQIVSPTVYLPDAPNYLTLSLSRLLFEAGQFQLPVQTQDVLFLVFLLAVLVEEAFVPFHTWLPDTHENADTGTNMLIGGVLMKVGLYVMLRFAVELLPAGLRHFDLLVAVLGVISILYGAFVALAERDWRRLIAFSGISHMGLVLLAIASMQAIGFQGAVFMLVSSGLLTALLFFVVGAQADRTGTFLIADLGGLSKRLPVLSGVLLFAALGFVGLPGLSGFISEFSSFVGSFATFPILAAVGTLGMILAAAYLLYAMQRTTFGPQKAEWPGAADARALEYVPMAVLVVLVVWIGVYPAILGDLVHGTVQAIAARIGG